MTTFQEGNRAADFIASLGHDLCLRVCYYVDPPTGLGSLLKEDIAGVAFPRLVS